MTNSANQPARDDGVLGGRAAIPSGAVILGGFEGLRRRLLSPIAQQRISALTEALQHGQKGLNLVIRALNDTAPEVRQAAYQLLNDRPEFKVQRALERFHARQHYTHLQSLLAAQKWKAADQETRALMLQVFGLDVDAQLRLEQLAEFPCTDLRIIDQLWAKYSQGRFGFGVQRVIWEKYDRLYWNKADVWSAFANRVGWRTNTLFIIENHWKRHHELNFTLSAPIGHLPFLGDQFGIFTIEAIADRLSCCLLPQTESRQTPSP